MRRVLAAIACCVGLSAAAWAGQCDCSKHFGTCSASAQLDLPRQTITFQSTTKACAQIVYSVAGEPSSVTIQGGSGATDYLVTNPNGDHSLKVDSCTVCPLYLQVDKACQDDCHAKFDSTSCSDKSCFFHSSPQLDACMEACPAR